VRIVINGDYKEVTEGATVAELIENLELRPERVAIELNRKILSRSEWSCAGLADGDKVEIVHFVGGGMPTPPSGGPFSAGRG
jgi:thiamine biosynthesis protein ThiS